MFVESFVYQYFLKYTLPSQGIKEIIDKIKKIS